MKVTQNESKEKYIDPTKINNNKQYIEIKLNNKQNKQRYC